MEESSSYYSQGNTNGMSLWQPQSRRRYSSPSEFYRGEEIGFNMKWSSKLEIVSTMGTSKSGRTVGVVSVGGRRKRFPRHLATTRTSSETNIISMKVICHSQRDSMKVLLSIFELSSSCFETVAYFITKQEPKKTNASFKLLHYRVHSKDPEVVDRSVWRIAISSEDHNGSGLPR